MFIVTLEALSRPSLQQLINKASSNENFPMLFLHQNHVAHFDCKTWACKVWNLSHFGGHKTWLRFGWNLSALSDPFWSLWGAFLCEKSRFFSFIKITDFLFLKKHDFSRFGGCWYQAQIEWPIVQNAKICPPLSARSYWYLTRPKKSCVRVMSAIPKSHCCEPPPCEICMSQES